MRESTTPRAWIGCLACYNAGALIGDWYDGTEAGEVTTEALHRTMFRPGTGPHPGFDAWRRENVGTVADYAAAMGTEHEELWIFDHEGYGGLLKGECSPVEAQRLAEVLAEHDDPDAFAAYADYLGDVEAAAEHFEDAYCGTWDDELAYAEGLLDDLGEVPDDGSILSRYFNYEAFARDLSMSDYYAAPADGGRVYVFSTNV